VADKNFESYFIERVKEGNVMPLTLPTYKVGEGVMNLAAIDASGWEPGNYAVRINAKDRGGNVRLSTELSVTIGDTARVSTHLFASLDGQEAANFGGQAQPPDEPFVFVEDDVPAGSTELGTWNWTGLTYSGARAHTSSSSSHYFIHANPGLLLTNADNLIQYVYFDGASDELLMQFYTDQGNGEHRVGRAQELQANRRGQAQSNQTGHSPHKIMPRGQ
jgi:hypothetical protein